MRAKFVYILSLILMPVLSQAVEPEWSYLASQKQVNYLAVVGDALYAATDGGLIVISDRVSPPSMYGSLDGLGTTVINHLMVDSGGDVWLAGTGRLVRFDPDNSEQFLFLDNQNKLIELLSVTDDNDLIWVGSELGLILFSKTIDGGQIQDSYQLFGDLNPNADINQIILLGDSIYLATDDGLAMADRSSVNALKSPSAWKTYGPNQLSILSRGVRSLALYNNDLYLSVVNGLYQLDFTSETFTRINFGRSTGECYELVIRNDSLLVYCVAGLGVVTSGTATIVSLDGLVGTPVTGVQFDASLWIGTAGNGLAYETVNGYQTYPFTGAPGNSVSDIAVDPDGIIFAGFGKNPFGRYSGTDWTEINRAVLNTSTDVMVDSSGRGWIGTWGGGIYMIDGDQVTNFTRHNSTLTGNSDVLGEDYEVIRGLDNDGRYLFAGAYRSLTDNPIAIADLNNLDNLSGWTTLGAAEGLTNHLVSCLDYQDGWLAVGTDAGGVYLYYLGPDPFDKSDDFVAHYTESDDRLASDIVGMVKFAPDGTLFVATNMGVSRWNAGYEWFDDVTLPGTVGPGINAIELDSRGNLWVGAQDGLGRINMTTGDGEHFTQLNSGLLSDKVRRLQYQAATGTIYAATEGGISIVGSFYGPPAANVAEGYSFPNPFVIRSDSDLLNFTYAEDGVISIFTIAGELMNEQSVNVGWDGTNQAGKKVASGLYIYIYTSNSGRQHQGKFLLVRD